MLDPDNERLKDKERGREAGRGRQRMRKGESESKMEPENMGKESGAEKRETEIESKRV